MLLYKWRLNRELTSGLLVLIIFCGSLGMWKAVCIREICRLVTKDLVNNAEAFICPWTCCDEHDGTGFFDSQLLFVAPVLGGTGTLHKTLEDTQDHRDDAAGEQEKTPEHKLLSLQGITGSDAGEDGANAEKMGMVEDGGRGEKVDGDFAMEGDKELSDNSANISEIDENIKDSQNGENLMENEETKDQSAEESAEESTDVASGQDEVEECFQRGKVLEIATEELRDYEKLVKQFYTVDPTTMVGSDQLNIDTLMGMDMSLKGRDPAQGPQILIYHTHSQEAFRDSKPGDPGTSIVSIGEELSEILRERYGYSVLHHEGEYDKPSRNEAYSRALPEIERILADNPSIEVVIDLHRDEMPESTRLVTEVDGRSTAKLMFFNGLSRTKRTGNLDYLYNPYQEENLAFSFQMEKAAQEYYPGLTRKIYLKGYRYNMHLKPKTLLIELGAQNNTVEEARNACGPLAHLLHIVLSGQES